jgi:predicted TIM-barrel fold metal-dependent hydrolase
MNQVFGPLFDASAAEAATPDLANQRAQALSGQFVIDGHTHFLRDDTRLTNFVRGREAVGKMGWNKSLAEKEQTLDDLKFNNYLKEIYMDSDTKVSLLSNSPSDVPEDWFIPQAQVFETRTRVNQQAGSRRMLAHFTITPGQPGWLDQVDEAVERFKPDSWKGYTVGDNTHKELAAHPFRLDDEKLMYPFYERAMKSGIRNVCVHKGLFAPGIEQRFPRLRPYADVNDVGKAAKDWPQLNFLIYHSAYRWVGGNPADGMAEFDQTGRSSWTSDLAEIPQKYGVNNVYGDLGQLFAWTAVAEPRLAAALMGMLVKGLGADRILWGTDALWTGAPQWQIEGLRRLEIPEDMQHKFGFAPLGAADGPVKTAIFSGNSARLYGLEKHAAITAGDRFASLKADYEQNGPGRSNLRYGFARA